MKYYKILVTIILLFGGLLSFLALNIKESKVSAELQDEVENFSLEILGMVPNWLSGTLIRNGPIKVTVNGQSNEHMFDGLAMLHAFSFHEGHVSYSNKFLRSDAYHKVFDKGSLDYEGFAADPSHSLFKKFLIFLTPRSSPIVHNANVNVVKLANEYVALTEVPLPVKFDIQTLDTLGVFDYQDELPKDKCWESAHPHYDFIQKETINYLIKFGPTSYYTFYKLKDGMDERKVIAEVPIDEPAYMHSFAVTENYIILTEYPLLVKPLDLITKNQPFIKNFTWQPEKGTRFVVINKKDGNIVGKYVTKPFFAFHHANAFEKDDLIHMDIVTYKDANIIIGENLYINSDNASCEINQSNLERLSLSLNTGAICSKVLFAKSNEFPRINNKLVGRPYNYVYAAGLNDTTQAKKELLSEGLYKVNTNTDEVLQWSEKGCSAGEPVFVEAPNAQEEDDGVVLTVILDHFHQDSFLLILDAKSFKEIGRARTPHVIPAGFHGQYFQ